EEVARIVGFDAIDHRPPVAPLVMAHQPEGQRTKSQLRNRMVGADYNEVVTYSFIDRALAEAFAQPSQLLPLQNPIAAQMAVMRPSLVPGLLTALTDNLARKESRVRVFEIGRKFIKDASVKAGPWSVQGVHQPVQLAALAYGDALGEQWATPARWVDFFDLKADLERLVSPLSLAFERPGAGEAIPAAGAQGLLANLHPGRAALVLLAGQVIGAMGELHPKLCQTLELAKAPVVFEIDLDAVLPRPIAQPSALSKFPAVTRDLAFVMPEQTAAGQVIAKVQEAARKAPNGQRLQRVVVFDEYRGTGLSDGEKSLAFRFVLQDTEKTLEDSEVDALMSVFSDTVQTAFSARVRR
ncbi:MAG: phenylalanine--tRNA ligase subunit beta, partial [Burkholderiaceae bacterium]